MSSSSSASQPRRPSSAATVPAPGPEQRRRPVRPAGVARHLGGRGLDRVGVHRLGVSSSRLLSRECAKSGSSTATPPGTSPTPTARRTGSDVKNASARREGVVRSGQHAGERAAGTGRRRSTAEIGSGPYRCGNSMPSGCGWIAGLERARDRPAGPGRRRAAPGRGGRGQTACGRACAPAPASTGARSRRRATAAAPRRRASARPPLARVRSGGARTSGGTLRSCPPQCRPDEETRGRRADRDRAALPRPSPRWRPRRPRRATPSWRRPWPTDARRCSRFLVGAARTGSEAAEPALRNRCSTWYGVPADVAELRARVGGDSGTGARE